MVEDAQRRLAGATRSVVAVEGDIRYPGDMLTMREIRDVIDFSRPVAVLLVAVLHFVPDGDRPWSAVRSVTDYLARRLAGMAGCIPAPYGEGVIHWQ